MTEDAKLSTADIARGASATEQEHSTDSQMMDRPIGEGQTMERMPEAARPAAGDSQPRTATSSAPARRVERPDQDDSAPLFAGSDAEAFRSRWTDIQAGFVDEPRSAVEKADSLVAEVIKNLADAFATERRDLEERWQQGGDPSTEDLRVALRRYRSFFDRLLSV
jgi:hypothetical protein